MQDIINQLNEGGYSCVIANRGETRTFSQPGVADLFALLKTDPDFMKGASIADKVIGKGAAALMILGGVTQVYTHRISESALSLFQTTGIDVEYKELVPFIMNRDRSGWCPVETLCQREQSPDAILPLIEEFINKMSIWKQAR